MSLTSLRRLTVLLNYLCRQAWEYGTPILLDALRQEFLRPQVIRRETLLSQPGPAMASASLGMIMAFIMGSMIRDIDTAGKGH